LLNNFSNPVSVRAAYKKFVYAAITKLYFPTYDILFGQNKRRLEKKFTI